MLEQVRAVGPFQSNCWILGCPETGEAVIIDPGAEPERILAAVQGMKTSDGRALSVKYLLHTHAHLDHFAATQAVREGLIRSQGAPSAPLVGLHPDDGDLWKNLVSQGAMFGLDLEEPPAVDVWLKHGDEVRFGALSLRVIHTPGHSPGGICFHLKANEKPACPETVYVGDTLFEGSIGRTDLWGGNLQTLLASIRTELLTLPEDARVACGHGPETRVGREKRENPFL